MSVRVSGPARRRGLPAVDRRLLRRRGARVLRALGLPAAELSVVLADDARIAELNASFRGRPRATDVLSFSLIEGAHAERRGALLGDVVIGVETAERQARAAGIGLDDEVARLLIHGVLHLLGHDHVRARERRVMRAEEDRLWESLAG